MPPRPAGNLRLVDADPTELVRSGYNAISRAYRSDDDPANQYGPWLASLLERIPPAGDRSWTSAAAAVSRSPAGWPPPGIR